MAAPFDRYGRVSRIGSRAERLRSRDWQDKDTMHAARTRGLKAGPFEYDPDESGANPSRRGLLRIIERIESGQSAGIIVAKLDRFSRDMRQALALAERIHEAGGKIISYAEHAEWTTPDGELQVHLALAYSHYQRRVLGAALSRAKASAVEAGIPVQPIMPPGLRLVLDEHGNRRSAEPDPDVAPIMVEFFRLRARGHGPTALGEFLVKHGIQTGMGSAHWSKPAVYGLIKNRAYLGELRNGDHVNSNAWPAIVDRATWEAAQNPPARVASRPRSGGSNGPIGNGPRRHEDIAVGLTRCVSCGYAMNATAGGRRRRFYRCQIDHAPGRCPDPARIAADDLDPLVLDAFWKLVREHHARGGDVEDTSAIDKLRATAERDAAALALYRDDPDLQATVEAMGGMAAWREGLVVRRQRAEESAVALAHAEAATVKPLIPSERKLRADWRKMDRETRRHHLASLIDCIAIIPTSSGLPLDRRVIVFAAGHGPTNLPRRGFQRRPRLVPIDIPPGTGVL